MVRITLITGKGRGKTALSMGVIFQNYSKGKSILVAQFLKTGKQCGECNFFENRKNISWFTFGKEGFFYPDKQSEEYSILMEEGINLLEQELGKNEVDLLVLDEVGVALHFGLLIWTQIEKIIQHAKDEIILTGRKFPEALKSKVDSIVDIQEIKHPYIKGIKARIGVDF